MVGVLALVVGSGAAGAAETTFTFGGYVKVDAMLTDYSDGEVAAGNGVRDFHIPGAIPVGGTAEDADVDFHARESRFNLKTETALDSGKKITSYFEMDFLLSPGGDERVSSSYNPRLRHAYFQYGNWTFGQTWMTFMIIALPDDLDFVGAADGSIFGRQAQIRYTKGPWQFAIENPETTVTPFGGGGRIVADDNSVPDLVGRYNFKGDWGTFSIAGILRELAYDDTSSGGSIDDSTNGWGVSVGGTFKTGAKDDIRAMLSTGGGLGRYIGLNFTNGAVINSRGELEAIDSTGGFIAYRHFWNDNWRSTVDYSFLQVDNDVPLTGLGANKTAESYSVNLLYSPTSAITIGAEYMHATRELESGVDGDMDRFQFSAKYAFSFATKSN
ncbi:MAG: porin [Acidobacteria bacterium]|nr:porin [Acidobacteriota bacterium]